MLGGVTRLDVPRNTDEPLPGSRGSDSLLARLRASAPNHPSSLQFGRVEQAPVREATARDASTAEPAGGASSVLREGHARQRDNASSAEMKADAETEVPVAADTTRPGERTAPGDRPPLDYDELAEHIE